MVIHLLYVNTKLKFCILFASCKSAFGAQTKMASALFSGFASERKEKKKKNENDNDNHFTGQVKSMQQTCTKLTYFTNLTLGTSYITFLQQYCRTPKTKLCQL